MKNILKYAYGTVAVLLLVFGAILVVGSFVKGGSDRELMEQFTTGLTCLMSSLALIGFSQIVQAAMTYLESNKKAED